MADDPERNDYIDLEMVPFRRRSASVADALDYEIAQEQASSLGRAGRALEAALAALCEHDHSGQIADDTRRELVADAGDALWRFIIQRECCGLRARSCANIGFHQKCKIIWESSARTVIDRVDHRPRQSQDRQQFVSQISGLVTSFAATSARVARLCSPFAVHYRCYFNEVASRP